MRVTIGCFALAGAAQIAAAQPETGLLWNRSGLPAVFPLRVSSAMPEDYVVVLREPGHSTDLFAAYLRASDILRVLVPPGTFEVGFLMPRALSDETAQPVFPLAGPLHFSVTGHDRKSGHLIEINEAASLEVAVITVTPVVIGSGLQPRARGLNMPGSTDEPRPRGTEVGAQILEQRFLRGLDVFEAYDPQRQQNDFDPPVRGIPRVPLVRPPRTGIPKIGPSSE